MNAQGQPTDCVQALKQLWGSLPACCRIVTYTTIVFYALWYLPPGFPLMLVDIPYYVFFRFEVYRLFFSVFVSRDAVDCFISLYFFLTRASKAERLKSSVKFAWEFIVITTLVHLLSSSILISHYCITGYQVAALMPASGLWPVVMFHIASQAYSNPDAETNLCGIVLKSRHMALFYLILLNFLAPTSFLVLVFSFVLGLLQGLRKLQWLSLTDERADLWASNLSFAWLTKVTNFVSTSEAGADELPFSIVQPAPVASPADIPQFVPFHGAGQRLGGNSNKYQRLSLEETKDPS